MARAGTVAGEAKTTRSRPKRLVTGGQVQSSAPAEQPPAETKTKTKTAVIVIHGIGEQKPLETLRGFVETVYQLDSSLAGPKAEAGEPLKVAIVPDDVTGSGELRRITTLSDGPPKRTDFFEFYWADIMDGTPVDMVTGWIRMLVLRWPTRVPKQLRIWLAWLLLCTVTAIVAAAAIIAVYPGLAAALQSTQQVSALGDFFAWARPGIAVILFAWAGLIVGMRLLKIREGGGGGSPVLFLGVVVAGIVVLFTPAEAAVSLQVWAGALTVFVGWALNGVIGPYAGDVVRYVRATPQTVERRRLVRERGVALLEALHRKRLNGPSLKDFTQFDTKNPPLYDRVVIVGHSLGTIIAYDILQLFWEKYGPTHHQKWKADDANVQEALAACDGFVKRAWVVPGQAIDLAAFEAAQTRLYDLLRADSPCWRISDLITLGSPLVHAEFLLMDSKDEVRLAFEERRFASAPPRPDAMQNSMLYPVPGLTEPPPHYPHFAAQFAAVHWTNIYDEHDNPLLGDLISGRLSGVDRYGPGVRDHQVAITRPGWLGPFKRLFTHTRYWAWHPSYESGQGRDDRNGGGTAVAKSEARSRANVPEHIRLLREALRLGQ